jgi:hypothetical protein
LRSIELALLAEPIFIWDDVLQTSKMYLSSATCGLSCLDQSRWRVTDGSITNHGSTVPSAPFEPISLLRVGF